MALQCGKHMATLVRGATVDSTSQAFPRVCGTSKVGRSACPSLRSPFFGSGRVHISSGVAQQSSKARAVVGVRSASFFDKLGKLFSSNAADEEQIVGIYEINELDRYSPTLLRLTPWKDEKGPKPLPEPLPVSLPKPLPKPFLGDLLPYTNKVYGPSGKDLLGVSAGICIVIENIPNSPTGPFYEAIFTHFIGKYGQLSVMGPYYGNGDSEMVITGGTGVFKGARGTVKCHNVTSPIRLLYTYYITGVPKLPSELTRAVVPLPEEASAATTPAPVSASVQ